MALRTLDDGKDWGKQGEVISAKSAEATAAFRGLQADLNFFADKVGFEVVKVDGKLGPATMAALRATNDAVVKKNPALNGTLIPPTSVEQTASYALHSRQWLETTARDALGVANLRRYHQGAGKEWNTKDGIAYGAGPIHEEFKGLQSDLNRFGPALGFGKLDVDGFLGAKTVAATKAVYDAVVKKQPILAATAFPVPDTKEELAEYAGFIRAWLKDVAAKQLLGGAGA
ncbi:MAG TPA: hypothetical protein VM734_02790 [Kofleriaceae bacterium]|jgi:lysozyme family protein|nr:hypothetical protein [Kofleriaceae bacterium]